MKNSFYTILLDRLERDRNSPPNRIHEIRFRRGVHCLETELGRGETGTENMIPALLSTSFQNTNFFSHKKKIIIIISGGNMNFSTI